MKNEKEEEEEKEEEGGGNRAFAGKEKIRERWKQVKQLVPIPRKRAG